MTPPDFGRFGSVHGHRYSWPMSPRSRRRCRCGCKRRATMHGGNNGVGLVIGCELMIARWVRDGIKPSVRRAAPATVLPFKRCAP